MPAACTHDGFSPLREVIVGDSHHARVPTTADPSMWVALYGDLRESELREVALGGFPGRILQETEEDLETLVETLHELDVVVRRPEPIDHGAEFGTPSWRSDGFFSYCPRDLTLILGSTLIETPSPMRARYFELFGLREIFLDYMRHGSAWISAPKGQLLDDLYSVDPEGRPLLTETEPAFEAANVIRCGRDLFYLVSSTGNELGLTWLENTARSLGDYRVHPLRDMYRYAHADSTIVPLRPGLVLLNPERVTDENLPDVFRKWDLLWCPPMTETRVPRHPLGSAWIGMNLLMVNPGLAIVDADQSGLIGALEEKGIDVIPRTLRHARSLGGGFHCVTLDTIREGTLESYFE